MEVGDTEFEQINKEEQINNISFHEVIDDRVDEEERRAYIWNSECPTY